MKTIKQIANELGVSKQAVRKKITPEIRNQFLVTNGNTIYITEQGETLIKSAFQKSTSNQVTSNEPTTTDNQVTTLIDMLKHELEIKDKQLEVKDNQISELTAALKASYSLHAGTIQNQKQLTGFALDYIEEQPTAAEEPDKPGFIERLWYRLKGFNV